MPNIKLSQKNISLDLQHIGYVNTIYAEQGDENARELTIYLFDDGKEYLIPNDSSVSLCGTRADRTVIYREVNSFKNNIVKIIFENAELAAKGIAKYKIEIKNTSEDGQIQLLTSTHFNVKVYENIYDENGKLASPQYSDLKKEFEKIREEEKRIEEAEDMRVKNENERIANENQRKQNESERVSGYEEMNKKMDDFYTKDEIDNKLSSMEVNQNAFSNIKVGSTTISADSKADTLELVAGDNITLTPDKNNDRITISSSSSGGSSGSDHNIKYFYIKANSNQELSGGLYCHTENNGKIPSKATVIGNFNHRFSSACFCFSIQDFDGAQKYTDVHTVINSLHEYDILYISCCAFDDGTVLISAYPSLNNVTITGASITIIAEY